MEYEHSFFMFITILDFAMLNDVALFFIDGSRIMVGNRIISQAHENIDVDGSNMENRFIIIIISSF
jgi:hypothetical protein